MYTQIYDSCLGKILLASDGESLVGLWFEGQKYFAAGLEGRREGADLPIFDATRRWLDSYFDGRDPGPRPPLAPQGTTFRQEVWQALQRIPYGATSTYGAIAQDLAASHGIPQMSARAVGGAVGHNPISIIIPCHRVVGADGSLTGYAGGIERKIALLELEGCNPNMLVVPTKGTTL